MMKGKHAQAAQRKADRTALERIAQLEQANAELKERLKKAEATLCRDERHHDPMARAVAAEAALDQAQRFVAEQDARLNRLDEQMNVLAKQVAHLPLLQMETVGLLAELDIAWEPHGIPSARILRRATRKRLRHYENNARAAEVRVSADNFAPL